MEKRFTPKFFYIKKTWKYRYVGQTIKEDVFSYPGSGSRWSRHLKKEGIKTPDTIVWVWCESPEDFQKCLDYYVPSNYVESGTWVNLKAEVPWDCGNQGSYLSDSTKSKIGAGNSNAHKRFSESDPEGYRNRQATRLGKKDPKVVADKKAERLRSYSESEEGRARDARTSERLRGKPKTEEEKASFRKPKSFVPKFVCNLYSDKPAMGANQWSAWFRKNHPDKLPTYKLYLKQVN